MSRTGRGGCLVAALGAVLVGVGLAGAATWGGIVPGQTTGREVQAQYGRPTRERTMVEEGRTVPEWTYAGDRAPRGLDRMVISFGFIRPQGFSPDVVRAVTIYPRPRVFSAQAIGAAWGVPDVYATEEATGRPALRYDAKGLFIILDKSGEWAELLLFAPERPAPQ